MNSAPRLPSTRGRAAGPWLALLGGLLLVLGLEALLRGLDWARPPSALRYQRVYPPLLRPDRLPSGEPVLATVDPRLPYQWVDPQDRTPLRLAVFGGSAVAGLGSSPNATLPRELERLLRAGLGGRPVEVLNLGVVALSSSQVRTLVEDLCASVRLDAVIVYSGNNEFLELHSLRFAQLAGTAPNALRRGLRSSRLLTLLRGTPPEPSPEVLERSITSRHLAQSDARVSHAEMMREVRLEPAEVTAVEARFEDNLRAMAAAARAAGVPIVFCTVGVNWRWTGLEDEGREWLAELGLDPERPDWAAALPLARAAAERATDAIERWHWQDRAARCAEASEQWAVAAELFRSAVDHDPHLRRSTSRHATRVRTVAAEEAGASLFDAEAALIARAPRGIVGFESFYDYVHFTPLGALGLAEDLASRLADLGLLEDYRTPTAELAARRAFLESAEPDALAVGDFVGFGPDRGLLESRDLWKYDTLGDELDRRLAADPADWRALVWRGNMSFFRRSGAAAAEADYRAAAALAGDAAIDANLERLLTDRRP
jgi:hypothetical protein